MHMDRAIFNQKASVEAVSLYIIVCSLLDEGLSPNLDYIRSRWSGDEEALHKAIDELAGCGILQSGTPVREEDTLRVNASDKWTCNG